MSIRVTIDGNRYNQRNEGPSLCVFRHKVGNKYEKGDDCVGEEEETDMLLKGKKFDQRRVGWGSDEVGLH